MFLDEKTQGEAAPAPVQVGTLKLSEAMRRGASFRPQGVTTLFHGGNSCALGAAYEAVYGYPGGNRSFPDGHGDGPRDPGDCLGERLDRAFPALKEATPSGERVKDHIWRMNDLKGFSREQIADWLESQGY